MNPQRQAVDGMDETFGLPRPAPLRLPPRLAEYENHTVWREIRRRDADLADHGGFASSSSRNRARTTNVPSMTAVAARQAVIVQMTDSMS